jgi:polyferredoxin
MLDYVDPWKWASLLKSTGNIISRVANCTNCAHCVELYTPKLDDPPQLKSIRDDQFITVMGWIEDHWRSFSHLS